MDVTVTLTVKRVRQIDNPDGWLAGDGDYYAKVRMDGVWRTSGHAHDKKDYMPNWTFRHAAAPTAMMPLRIELWDHDSTSGDDLCDINPNGGAKRLDFTYNVATGQIAGDVTGSGGTQIHARGAGDGDRAEIWFQIDQEVQQLPQQLPEVWASDLKIKVLWNAIATGSDLDTVRASLRAFNDRLYRCTDGQWRIARFLLHDNRSELGNEDAGVGHIHRTGAHGEHGHADGRPNSPKHWHVNENSSTATYLMEFLHSWTGLKDEYETEEDGSRTNCPASASLRDASQACVMDTTHGTPTKLCRPETHNPNTEQGKVRGMDCYSWLRKVMHEAGKTGFQVPTGHIAGPTNAPACRFVFLSIRRVRQIDNPDGWLAGTADYYAKVRMDGVWLAKSKHSHDRTEVTPNWVFGIGMSSDAHRVIPIRIQLWDHDTTSGDDHCDISPTVGKRDIDLTYDTATGLIAGDVVGVQGAAITSRGAGDSDRAEIEFVVTSPDFVATPVIL